MEYGSPIRRWLNSLVTLTEVLEEKEETQRSAVKCKILRYFENHTDFYGEIFY